MFDAAHKRTARTRRAARVRGKIRELDVHRLCVHRTPRHIYAQVTTANGGVTLASASTLEKALRDGLAYTGNRSAATAVGRAIAERARQAGIKRVAFDRSGLKYHGRVKALADAAREGGLEF